MDDRLDDTDTAKPFHAGEMCASTSTPRPAGTTATLWRTEGGTDTYTSTDSDC